MQMRGEITVMLSNLSVRQCAKALIVDLNATKPKSWLLLEFLGFVARTIMVTKEVTIGVASG